MLIWSGVIGFTFIAAAMFFARRHIAHMQSMLWGATMPSGCVTAQAVIMLILGACIYFFRNWFE